jgi:mannose-6-phosphate isomerase
MSYYKEERPWGNFENIFESNECKVKKITVYHNKRPSYQYHFHRAEDWHIVQGDGVVTLDGKNFKVTAGDTVYVPQESRHRIHNTGIINLIFIEIQTGDYFGEDDIVRLEDDYKREA